MSIKQQFAESVLELAVAYEMPHFKLDGDGRCSIRYNDEFDVEFFVNDADAIQMHAYLLSVAELQAVEDEGFVYKKLLCWNESSCDLVGSYYAINEVSQQITFNLSLTVTELDRTLLENILNNFLDKASNVNEQFNNEFLRAPITRTQNDFNSMNGFILC